MTNRIATALAAILTLAALGCDSKPKTGTVKGVVTLEGQIIVAGQVCFLPPDGKSYCSDIDPASGSYRIDNVPLGDAAVIVNPPLGDDASRHMAIKEGKGNAPLAHKFPARYSNQDTSKLKHTVTTGESTYDIKMTK